MARAMSEWSVCNRVMSLRDNVYAVIEPTLYLLMASAIASQFRKMVTWLCCAGSTNSYGYVNGSCCVGDIIEDYSTGTGTCCPFSGGTVCNNNMCCSGDTPVCAYNHDNDQEFHCCAFAARLPRLAWTLSANFANAPCCTNLGGLCSSPFHQRSSILGGAAKSVSCKVGAVDLTSGTVTGQQRREEPLSAAS